MTLRTRIAIHSGPGTVDESPYLAFDRRDRLWVGKSAGLVVYGPDGSYLQTVGRYGPGPGEFSAAGPLAVDSAGNIHVFDPVAFRETIYSDDLKLQSIKPTPLGPTYDVVMGRGSAPFAINALLVDPARAGIPVHELAGDSIIRSFGAPDDTVYAPSSIALKRQLVRLSNGYLVAARRYNYALELFDQNGVRRLLIHRVGAWPSVAGVPPDYKRGEKLPGYVQDITVDSQDRVWILSMEPRDDWEKNARDVVYPNGERGVMPTDDGEPWFRSRIDVIDVKSGALVAEYVTPRQLWGFLGASSLYGYDYTGDGEPQLVVFDVDLKSPGK
jgi:hypothetical protein